MIMRLALPLFALLPGACAGVKPPEPIPAMAEQRQCPAYPLPPAQLLKPPVKIDFINPTG